MKNTFHVSPGKHLLFLLAGCFVTFLLAEVRAQVSPYSVLVNGDFESGSSGNGFQVPSPYNFLGTPPALSGTSNPGDYAITTNPNPMNSAFFINATDHSGSGNMMIVDGTTTGGQQRFWKAGNSGGGVGPLVVGQTYTFSYWVLNVSTSSVDAATSANIGVAWNNAGSITLVSGSQQVAFPGSAASVWQQVVYTFVPTNNFVNIELYNNNTSAAGNDFAIDDLEVLPPPVPLSIRYSYIPPGCNSSGDGFITAYGSGGTPPYQYSLNGSPFQSSNIFSSLGATANATVSVRDAATPAPTTVSSAPVITLTAPANPVTIRPDTTLCAGASVVLWATGANSYSWSANPADPTLTSPNAASTTVSPTVNTQYTVTGQTSTTRNLIFNGDFSQGDIGFYSDYQSMATNPSGLQRAYGIVTNPNTFETWFSALCTDHTSGSGKMMVVDGSTIANQILWNQKVAVTPGVNYTFTMYLQTVGQPNPASIEVQINGLPITGNLATSTINAPAADCNWATYTATWNSAANTTADIVLYDRVLFPSGNDFAIDDLSFTYTPVCNDPRTVNITVNPLTPAVTSFTYPTPVCSTGSNPSPTGAAGFTTGGIWTAPAGVTINASTGVIDLATSTPGTYSITYTVAASGCAAGGSSNFTITITGAFTPVTSFTLPASVCSNSGTINPTAGAGFTSGGVWSSSAGLTIDPVTGAINPLTSTPGLYSVNYTVASTSCSPAGVGSANITITAPVTPVTGFSYASPVCSNASNPLPVPVAGFTAGGTFSSTAGLSINSTTGLIDLAASTPSTYTITYSVAASGCNPAGSSTSAITITAGAIPVTNFSYSTPVCTNGTNPVPVPGSGFTTGGTYTSTAGLTINSTTGVIDLATSTPGSYTVTYTVAASGCAPSGSGTASIVITTGGSPVTGFTYPNATVCISGGVDPVPVPAAGFTPGGFFSAPVGLSINTITGVINLAASTAGSYTVTYAVNSSGCITAGSSTFTITLSNSVTPVTSFSYTSTVCSNAADQSPALVSGFTSGGTFSAPAGLVIDAATGVVNVAGSTPGNYTVTYTLLSNGCNPTTTGTASISIVAVTNAVTNFSYTGPVCLAAANPVPVTVSGFTTGGVFTSSNAGVSVNAATGVINLAASTPGTYTISYAVPTNGCILGGTGLAGISITANNNPVTGFSYPTPVCVSGSNPMPVLSAGFNTGGTFTGPAGLSINGNTGEINLSASTSGIYTVSYTFPPTGCFNGGAGSANIELVANTPIVTGFTYPTPLCGNAPDPAPVLATGFTPGGTFSSTPGLSVDPVSGSIHLPTTTAGSYTVTYTLASNACNATSNTGSAPIVVHLVPTPPAVSPASRCGEGIVTLRANGSGTLNWYSDFSLTDLVATGNTFIPSLASSATFYVTDSNSNCASLATPVIATIHELPEKPRLGGDTSLCPGNSIVLNAGAHDSYLWQDGSTSSLFTVNTTGIYTVSVNDGGVCWSMDTIAVNVMENCEDISFPSAFTPNADGLNDKFGPAGNLFLITDFVLKVYNRTGVLVYSSYNAYQRWDGQLNGTPLAPANFVYVAEYRYRGMKKIQKGNVVLIR